MDRQQALREARRLDSELSLLIQRYSGCASRIRRACDDRIEQQAIDKDQTVAVNVERDVRDRLQQLAEAVTALEQHISTHSGSKHHAAQYRMVLVDHSRLFDRHKSSLKAAVARRELFAASAGGALDGDLEGQTEQNQLLAERESLLRVNRLADSILEQGTSAQATLQRQNAFFRELQNATLTLSARFPGVQKLIGRIKRAKQRNMIVLALTVAVCLFLMALYSL